MSDVPAGPRVPTIDFIRLIKGALNKPIDSYVRRKLRKYFGREVAGTHLTGAMLSKENPSNRTPAEMSLNLKGPSDQETS